MKKFKIHSKTDQSTLFEGRFRDFRSALAAAVSDGADLRGADLRNKNLVNANLDDGKFRQADFSFSNLTGANLSECDLRGTDFAHADLYNCCFACSDLYGARFGGASFGATDITGANLSGATFNTLSCFSLDFTLAKYFANCVFVNPDGSVLTMSRPPIVIRGFSQLAVITDDCIKIGQRALKLPKSTGLIT